MSSVQPRVVISGGNRRSYALPENFFQTLHGLPDVPVRLRYIYIALVTRFRIWVRRVRDSLPRIREARANEIIYAPGGRGYRQAYDSFNVGTLRQQLGLGPPL